MDSTTVAAGNTRKGFEPFINYKCRIRHTLRLFQPVLTRNGMGLAQAEATPLRTAGDSRLARSSVASEDEKYGPCPVAPTHSGAGK